MVALMWLTALDVSECSAQRTERPAPSKPKPDLANVSYGPHPRNVLDFWRAPSAGPAPLMVFIHGGGFRSGSKEEKLPPLLLEGCLKAGISVMAINYRLTPEVVFPAHYLDCARAIQFARLHAREWNIDASRIGACGGSAGAITSLWLGFHDDMADPASPDPVLRQSTRLACMAVMYAQSTFDPRTIKEWIGEAAAKHPVLKSFYGLKDEEVNTPKAFKLYEAAAPINRLTKDDPPVYAFYLEARGPLPPNAKPGQGIHHITFGLRLKEKMDQLGIECIVRHRDEGAASEKEMVEFLARHLKPAAPTVDLSASGRAQLPLVLARDAAPEVRARLRDLVLYTRFAELVFAYESTGGAAHVRAYREVADYGYRILDTNMATSFGVLRSEPTRHKTLKSPVVWNDESGVASPQGETKVTPHEVEALLRQGIARNALTPFEPVAFSRQLAPAGLARDGAAPGPIKVRGTTSLYLSTAKEGDVFEFTIRGGM